MEAENCLREDGNEQATKKDNTTSPIMR